jgi:hypothetical protein
LFACLAFSLDLKMEAVRSSETSMDLYRTTQRHILKDGGLRRHRSESLKSRGFSFTLSLLHLALPPPSSLRGAAMHAGREGGERVIKLEKDSC